MVASTEIQTDIDRILYNKAKGGILSNTLLYDMNKTKFAIILALLFAASSAAYADSSTGVWTPNPKFRIEDSSYRETLTFVSGISYALSSSAMELARTKKQNFFCLRGGSTVGSKLLVDILSEKHSGNITPEQAIETIIQGLKTRYPC